MATRRQFVAAALIIPVTGFAMRTRAQVATPPAASEAGIAYADRNGTPQFLDVFLPASGNGPYPAVLLFHGGAWTFGISGPQDMHGPAAAMADAGYAAFVVSYRLTGDPAGEHVWPDQIDDAQEAVRWVRANANQYEVDPDRVSAYGHSAGGHLAAHLGVRDTREDSVPELAGISSRVNGVVAIAGHFDFSIPYPQEFDRQSVAALLGGTVDEIPDVYADASPITWVDTVSAPFLILHGGADDMNPPAQARTMTTALQEAGVTVISMEDAAGDHFTVAEWDYAGPWTLAFLNSIAPASR